MKVEDDEVGSAVLPRGFPMSQYLKDKVFVLGQRSRRLASHSTTQLEKGNGSIPTKGQTTSPKPASGVLPLQLRRLFWRALLQEVCVDAAAGSSDARVQAEGFRFRWRKSYDTYSDTAFDQYAAAVSLEFLLDGSFVQVFSRLAVEL